MSYSDSALSTISSYHEDFWTHKTDIPTYLRGMYAVVVNSNSGAVAWSGYLGHGDYSGAQQGEGCTNAFYASSPFGSYEISVWSFGKIFSNTILVRSRTSNFVETISTDEDENTSSYGTYVIEMTTGTKKNIWKTYLASAFAAYRNIGGLQNKTIYFRVGPEQPGDPCDSCLDGNALIIYIGNLIINYKFDIVHEMGHFIHQIGSDFGEVGCQGFTIDGSCGAESHNYDSIETSKCAISEGFAGFYSAQTWNSTSSSIGFYNNRGASVAGESNPIIKFGGPGTGTNPALKLKVMKTYCSASNEKNWSETYLNESEFGTNWEGLGNELDWGRVFWGMAAGYCGPNSGNVTVSNMLDWMYNINWTETNQDSFEHNLYAYNDIDQAANIEGGNINKCFDAFKGPYGVNTPFTNPDGD